MNVFRDPARRVEKEGTAEKNEDHDVEAWGIFDQEEREENG